MHSRYIRRIADEPIGGRPVTILLQVRRFRCTRRPCPRRTFAEQAPRLAARAGRRTVPLDGVLLDVGVTIGGRPGARFAARRGIRTSRTTLVRLVRAVPEPTVIAPAVLGVDDFALRRGPRYGTILVDLLTHRPIDLLADRTAETFAAWLLVHGRPRVICRDRGGAYADGARQGAPDAVQVADRFHLLRNSSDVLERVLARHPTALRASVVPDTRDGTASEAPAGCTAAVVVTGSERLEASQPTPDPRRERRRVRYEEVVALARQGWAVRAIGRELSLSRATVTTYLRAGAFPEWAPRRTRLSAGTDHAAHLQARWAAGCRDATVLGRELRACGFTGSQRTVERAVATWRVGPRRRQSAPPVDGGTQPAPDRLRPPSPRQAVWLLLRPEAALTAAQRTMRDRLRAAAPVVAATLALLDAFRGMVQTREGSTLAPWFTAAEACGVPEIRSFAASLRRDEAAVAAGLTLPWSSGAVEGHANRTKLIKRQMYGRATFALLRRRVLLAS